MGPRPRPKRGWPGDSCDTSFDSRSRPTTTTGKRKSVNKYVDAKYYANIDTRTQSLSFELGPRPPDPISRKRSKNYYRALCNTVSFTF
jgi:hypothetical protein